MALILLPLDRTFRLALIKAFHDGRGDGRHDDLVVLSGIVPRSDDVLKSFQEDWNATVLSETRGISLSVTDFLSSKSKTAQVLPEDVRYDALRKAVARLEYWTAHGLCVYSSVIMMDDYRRCASEGNAMPLNPPEAICVDDIVPWAVCQFPEDHFELYFDQNERFIRHVSRYWAKSPHKRSLYLKRVELVAQASKLYSAIQAADVYTWSVYTYAEMFWLKSHPKYLPPCLAGIIGTIPPMSSKWDYEQLSCRDVARYRVLAVEK